MEMMGWRIDMVPLRPGTGRGGRTAANARRAAGAWFRSRRRARPSRCEPNTSGLRSFRRRAAICRIGSMLSVAAPPACSISRASGWASKTRRSRPRRWSGRQSPGIKIDAAALQHPHRLGGRAAGPAHVEIGAARAVLAGDAVVHIGADRFVPVAVIGRIDGISPAPVRHLHGGLRQPEQAGGAVEHEQVGALPQRQHQRGVAPCSTQPAASCRSPCCRKARAAVGAGHGRHGMTEKIVPVGAPMAALARRRAVPRQPPAARRARSRPAPRWLRRRARPPARCSAAVSSRSARRAASREPPPRRLRPAGPGPAWRRRATAPWARAAIVAATGARASTPPAQACRYSARGGHVALRPMAHSAPCSGRGPDRAAPSAVPPSVGQSRGPVGGRHGGDWREREFVYCCLR